MKKIFLIFAAAAALFAQSCSDSVNENSAEGTGKVALNLAIPRFIVPKAQSSQDGRMIMPSTSVIKFKLYKNSSVDYSKEFELISSSVDERYNYVAMELDDVPVGNYSNATIELCNKNGETLTEADKPVGDGDIEVAENIPLELSFFALPKASDYSTVEFDNGVYDENIDLDDETVANYAGIWHQVFFIEEQQVNEEEETPYIKFFLSGSNPKRYDVAIMIYSAEGDGTLGDVIFKSNASNFDYGNEIVFEGQEDFPANMDYYVVLYTNGGIEDLSIKFELD